MEIYLEKVKIEEKEILYKLLQYSLYEESLNDGNEMTNEAIFKYKYFERYFTEDNREAFFIKDLETNKLMGFVMINTYLQVYESGHSIAEFMVIPKYRRNKIGKEAALKCFDMHKGNWEVSPSLGSKTAYEFWKNVIEEYTKGSYSFNNRLFTFNNESRE